MKKIILVCIFLSFVGLAFAQENMVPREEHLLLAKSHAEAQIAFRQAQIQRLQDQIEVWRAQLNGINAELLKIEEQKNPKKKVKDK